MGQFAKPLLTGAERSLDYMIGQTARLKKEVLTENRKLNEPGTVFEYNDVRVNLLAYSLPSLENHCP
jgi:hypothetical protein